MTPLETITRLLVPLRNRIANMVARGVVQLVNDAAKVQIVQLGVSADEVRTSERMQEYGFTSHPHPGAEAVVVFVGGRRDHGLVVSVDDRRYRLADLQEGESAQYSDEGDYVLLKRGRVVEIKAGTRARVDSPALQCTGTVESAGGFLVAGNQVVGARGATVPLPAGGGNVDAEARTAIGAIVARMRAHGLIT